MKDGETFVWRGGRIAIVWEGLPTSAKLLPIQRPLKHEAMRYSQDIYILPKNA
jgi:hypothetical protein